MPFGSPGGRDFLRKQHAAESRRWLWWRARSAASVGVQRLNREYRRARRLAAFEVAMGLGRLLQGIALVDFYLDLAGEHDVEQILRHRHQIGALSSIGVERRAREEERALLHEDAEINRTNRPGGLPEAHHEAERAQAVERLQEGIFADAVIDDGNLLAVGQFLHALHEILARVDDRIIAAVGFRELGR